MAKARELQGPIEGVYSEDSPVTVEITVADQLELLKKTVYSLRETHGYKHGVKFFVVDNSSMDDTWKWIQAQMRTRGDDWLNAVRIKGDRIPTTQAMNIPITWRELGTPYMHVVPGVVFEEQGWLRRWVMTTQMNPDVYLIQAWPYWCHESLDNDPKELYSPIAYGLGHIQFFHPRAVDAFCHYSEFYKDDAYKAAGDYAERIRKMRLFVWSDMHLRYTHLDHKFESAWDQDHSEAETLRAVAMRDGYLNFRCQYNGLDWDKYELARDVIEEAVA